MKKLTLLFLVSLYLQGGALMSLQYFPFPDTNATWNCVGENDFTLQEWRFRYAVYGDTMIGSHLYTKIYEMYDSTILHPNSTYFAAIRENDNKQVFCLIPGFPEVMLYDFNLEPGDTVFYSIGGGLCYDAVEFWEEEHYRVVTSKDLAQLPNGQYRNRWVLSGSLGYQSWIEGIGCIEWYGLLNPIISAMALCGDSYQFACFKENDTVLYLNNPFCDNCFCQLLTRVDDIMAISDEVIQLYPNPSDGEFTLAIQNTDLSSVYIEVVDLVGKILFERQFSEFENKVVLSDMKPGLYFVKLYSHDRGKLGMKKIIIE